MDEQTDKLKTDIVELNKRINQLEDMIRLLLQPLQDVRKTTTNYLRLAGLILDHGGLTPDLVLPELKDPISKEIVRILMERPDQNISQITEQVRAKRGTSSRRIIRARIEHLEDIHIVEKTLKGKIYTYHLSPNVLKKWSQVLGLPIYSDQTTTQSTHKNGDEKNESTRP